MTTIQDRIKLILEEFISANTINNDLIREFREWLLGNGHEEEKQRALRELMESNIRFDPNPGEDVREAYKKISLMLGFEENGNNENDILKKSLPIRNIVWRVTAVMIPVIAVLSSAFYLNKAESDEQLMAAKEITLTIPEGKMKKVALPDSSSKWENSNSGIVYAEELGGESMVKHSEEVLSTVGKADSKPMLNENQELEYDLFVDSVSVTGISEAGPSWGRNVINFRQASATEVLNSLGEMHGYSIEADDATLSENIVTLSIEEETGFNEVLSIMSEMCGFNYRVSENTVRIEYVTTSQESGV